MMEGHRSTGSPPNEPSPAYFVAVHVGAGRHSRKAEQLYKAGEFCKVLLHSELAPL